MADRAGWASLEDRKAQRLTLRKWRKRKGWAQVDLACVVQISTSSVSQIELGNQIPRVDMAQRIAEALGVATDDIAWGKAGDIAEE